jgi:hypothetical protein
MRNRNDDDYVLQDGESVTVRLNVMDAQQRQIAFDGRDHQPGYRTRTADSASHDAAAPRMEWLATLRDAWKSPAQRSGQRTKDGTVSSFADADPIAARNEMIRTMSDAWKARPRDQAPDEDEDDPSEPANAVQEQ